MTKVHCDLYHQSTEKHRKEPALLKQILAGLDAAEKKFGQGKVNPEQSRGINEKITDGARSMFEKATGWVLLCYTP